MGIIFPLLGALLLFFLLPLALIASFMTVGAVILNPLGGNIGAGALIVALLGAPFLIWRTIIAHRTLGFQKEGHITDRINKAVEQLGAEKKVDRIGRPITVWTGEPTVSTEVFASEKYIEAPERAKELSRKATAVMPDGSQGAGGFEVEYRKWPSQRTAIEWQGKAPDLQPHEHVGVEGEWKVFSESVPNIEVRLGGILSLERIAQDSTAYDKGRDHVRVMEILCAYIRENAPASTAKDHSYGEWEPLKDDPTPEERAAHEERRKERFGKHHWQGQVVKWAAGLPSPREDIAQALKVIGRRTPEQRRVEVRWGSKALPDAEWVFDIPTPELPEIDGSYGEDVIETFRQALYSWRMNAASFENYGYRLDLRATNLQGADMSGLVWSGTRFDGACLEGANLRETRLQCSDFSGARLGGAYLRQARLEGALFFHTKLEGANLSEARLEGAALSQSRLAGAALEQARLCGTNLTKVLLESARLLEARLEGASLVCARLNDVELILARMEGADLTGARLDDANLTDARLEDVLLIGCDLANATFNQGQLATCFGDASTTLPEDCLRPAHWPDWKLDWRASNKELKKWRADPDSYVPPPKPADDVAR